MSLNFAQRLLRYLTLALIVALSLALYSQRLRHSCLYNDDFTMVVAAKDLRSALHHLFVPHNEHMSPVMRLTTGLLVAAGGLRHIAALTLYFDLLSLALLLGALLVFLRNENVSWVAALIAVACFGITPVYYEAVAWYASSWMSVCLLFIVLGLICIQFTIEKPSRTRLGLSLTSAAGFLAAASSSSGILAAVFFPLFICTKIPDWRRRFVWTLSAVSGIAFYLCLYFLLGRRLIAARAEGSLHHPDLCFALATATRFFIDVILGSLLGRPGFMTTTRWPDLLCVLVTLGMIGLGLWAAHKGKALVAIGLCAITSNYVFCLMFRSHIGYKWLSEWGRYEIFAQLGLALLIAAIFSRLKARPPTEILYPVLLALGLFLFHADDRRLAFHNRQCGQQTSQLARLQTILERAHGLGVREPEVSSHLASYHIDGQLGDGFAPGQLYVEPAGASASWDVSLEP